MSTTDAPRYCYRHPDRETGLSCSECGRPICYECMTPAPVGLRCPEHSGKPQGVQRVTRPAQRAVTGVGARRTNLLTLTLIGIMVGHWLFNAPFTATSMIGFIALAGIIVRNSILLVDFIRHARSPGRPLLDVLLEAGAVRFKPILLTAIAAMIGAAVILADPIFQGLAISLLFGLASSTLLTVLVIPAIYVALRR